MKPSETAEPAIKTIFKKMITSQKWYYKLAAIFMAVSIILNLQSCSDSQPTVQAPKCSTVHMYGDSITHQAGLTIAEFLPCWSIENNGVDGTAIWDMPMPDLNKNHVYTISYGTNECLSEVNVEIYKSTLNHVLVGLSGYKVVVEAPWRVTHPSCRNIEDYRQAAVFLGNKYNIPVVLEQDQTHIGDGIHLPYAHTRERARLLAEAVLKL